MTFREWIDLQAQEGDGIRTFDGLDAALIGLTEYQPGRPVCAVYDYEKCVDVFREQFRASPDNEGKSEAELDEEAREWMDFNVVGAWLGDDTPVFLVIPIEVEDL